MLVKGKAEPWPKTEDEASAEEVSTTLDEKSEGGADSTNDHHEASTGFSFDSLRV